MLRRHNASRHDWSFQPNCVTRQPPVQWWVHLCMLRQVLCEILLKQNTCAAVWSGLLLRYVAFTFSEVGTTLTYEFMVVHSYWDLDGSLSQKYFSEGNLHISWQAWHVFFSRVPHFRIWHYATTRITSGVFKGRRARHFLRGPLKLFLSQINSLLLRIYYPLI